MPRLLAEVRHRDRLLWVVGLVHLGLALAMTAGSAVDDRSILGINPWVKPLKFAVSITIYVWTVAWLLGHVRPVRPLLARVVSVGVSVSMLVEIACIAGQSLRGAPSHFAVRPALDAAVFSVMGLMIALNTLLAALLALFFMARRPELPRPYLWGIRLGLLVFLLGSGVGGLMVRNMGHTVGGRDGGPGLPFVNWSTEAGDLRIAHALGLHALQLLPLAGWLAHRRLAPGRATLVVLAVGLAYAAAGSAAWWQAASGRPLVRISVTR